MSAEDVYGWLIDASTSSTCDDFDCHVVGAILSLAFAEAEDGSRTVLDGTGLTKGQLLLLASEMFPAAVARIDRDVRDVAPQLDTEEQSVRDILTMYCSKGDRLERDLIAMIARRAKAPHHLWQDLGLRDRGELSQLMKLHFAPLAEKNRNDMKWKKFLYRMVCGAEGFTLCTAPVCSECDDFHVCFGAEDGESRLAWLRNGTAQGAPQPAAAEPASPPLPELAPH